MESSAIPMYIVDAFTDKPFFGNQAAVCLVRDEQISDEVMQKIGTEMNLSETVFVILKEGNFETAQCFGIRWFSPTTEVNLCGHATLASAAVLFFKKCNRNDSIQFKSKSGELTVQRGESGRISLNFPANPPVLKDLEEFTDLLQVCVKDLALVHSVHLNKQTNKLLVRLVDTVTRKQLEAMKPQIDAMMMSEPSGRVKGVGLTIVGSRDNGCVDSDGNVYDFVSRYFAPWLGIPEDPVTGSWHTVAACYWSQVLSKSTVYARQCSRRGGDLWVDVKGDDRVTISGKAVINLEGVFSL